MRKPVRILIVDDHALVREGLVHYLASNDGINVIGEAPDGAAAVEMVTLYEPDIVLMDYNMPHLNGVEATRQILTDHPDVVVIGLTLHDRGPVATAMLEAGAAAVITKGENPQNLPAKIRELSQANSVCKPPVGRASVQHG